MTSLRAVCPSPVPLSGAPLRERGRQQSPGSARTRLPASWAYPAYESAIARHGGQTCLARDTCASPQRRTRWQLRAAREPDLGEWRRVRHLGLFLMQHLLRRKTRAFRRWFAYIIWWLAGVDNACRGGVRGAGRTSILVWSMSHLVPIRAACGGPRGDPLRASLLLALPPPLAQGSKGHVHLSCLQGWRRSHQGERGGIRRVWAMIGVGGYV